MTPFDLRLRHELDAEFVRMANEWFFKWHNINIEGRVVEVEDFFGGRFHTGGIEFWGTVRDLYWRSVEKYLVDLIHKTFAQWDTETRNYPADQRRESIADMSMALRQHSAKIVAYATDTDRRLRGKGFPGNVQTYNSTGIQTAANVTIDRLRDAHLTLLAEPTQTTAEEIEPPLFKRLEGFAAEWRGTVTLISLGLAVVGLIVKFLVG
jgi:hypothetical protein